ncbi:MAG: hypothetical protein DWQ02_00205 [Bacteroidetes bacterium]|nr:MAG: hypothetical protein DWQ02_00205 [Bacteroidota bacterium]
MKSEKEKWVNSVMGSLAGLQRAKPGPDLFAKIEREIVGQEGKIISMSQLRVAAAAAILLLAINVFLLNRYAKSETTSTSEWVSEVDSDEQLISNYNLYE